MGFQVITEVWREPPRISAFSKRPSCNLPVAEALPSLIGGP